MHLNCKLIHSSSLSHKELGYILTPDEYVRQLSREKNLQNIVNQLPMPLRQSLSLSASKTSQSLLFSLNQKLTKAEWVAVSTTARKTELSGTQLVQYPQLKKQIDRVEATQPTKIVKANFKPVTDDVPLERNLSFTPITPSPEHKIAVEFAGQWPNNAASLMLSKSGEQKEKIAKPRADIHASHRSIATFKDLEPEPRNLYLTVPMNGTPQPLKLLLAENIQPVEKEAGMDEWENVLVPVVPLHFTNSDKSDEGSDMFNSGYVYVIWNNKIWREIVITADGYFSDTDINSVREDFRPRRHVDIYMANPETGSIYSYEPFQIVQNGHVVSEGSLNGSGEARVFNLLEDEVEIVMTGYEPQIKAKVETHLSPVNASSSSSRSAQGYPLPHIWLPYKVKGEPQEVYLAYSGKQLSDSDLSDLESDPRSRATKVIDLDHYSSEKSFKIGEGQVRLLSVLPSTANSKLNEFAMLQQQLNKNVAAVYLNKPIELVFEYSGDATLDESDDYFELRQTEGGWSQRVCLRECSKKENNSRLISFSGWPEEVKEVDLIRGYQGNSRHGRDNQTTIFAQTSIADLQAHKKKD